MIHITVTREEDYYFREADIKRMAEDNKMSIEDCKAALVFGEFEQSEVEHYCCDFDGVVTHYDAVEEKE